MTNPMRISINRDEGLVGKVMLKFLTLLYWKEDSLGEKKNFVGTRCSNERNLCSQ